MVKGKLLTLKGSVGIYPANSVGDDIEIYGDEGRQEVKCRFFGLRQQVAFFFWVLCAPVIGMWTLYWGVSWRDVWVGGGSEGGGGVRTRHGRTSGVTVVTQAMR